MNKKQIASPRYSLVAGNFAGRTLCIAPGRFTSVVVHRDQVYAADSKKSQTQVFQRNDIMSPRWIKIRSIDHDFNLKGFTLTLSISNNQLKCCSAGDGIIKVYSLSGELLQTYGKQGCGDAGQLQCPFISDDDDDGSVLIADQGNNRLQVMSEQGEFSVLQLQPPVSEPRNAVLFNNQLYVMSDSYINYKVCKYSC